jgi:hypothetical protein
VLALGELLREALTGGAADGVTGPLAELVEACLADAASRPAPERVAQLARRLVTPEPVDLTAAPAPAASPRPGWRPLPGSPVGSRPVPATHLARPASSVPSGRPAAAPAVPPRPAADADDDADAGAGRRRGRRILAVVATVVAGAGLTAGALALALRTDGPSDPAPVAGGPGGTPSPQRPSSGPSAAGPGAARPSAGVPGDVTAVVGRLAAARAAALSSASEGSLTRVDAPGSTALAQDVALVRRLHTAGIRLEGLRFTVTGVRLVAATADGVTVEARVATSAHRQVRADGTVERSVAALPARRVQLTLVRVGGEWRVSTAL